MTYLFVGEQRSAKAISMGVRWEDGRLCAKPLFEALESCGVNPQDCSFTNWFEPDGRIVVFQSLGQRRLVALGQRVTKAMTERGLPHLALIHPAARGRIRRRDRYIAHVRSVLLEE